MELTSMWPVLAAALLALCAGAQAAPPPTDSTRTTMTTQHNAPGGMFTLSDLKPLLPARAGIWRQQNFGVKTTDDNGVAGTWVSGNYSAGAKKAKLTITDLGDVAGAATATPWTGPPVESDGQKTYGEGGRTVREEDKRGGKREVTIVLGNGIAIGAAGVNIDMAELKQLATGVDLARAEGLARPRK